MSWDESTEDELTEDELTEDESTEDESTVDVQATDFEIDHEYLEIVTDFLRTTEPIHAQLPARDATAARRSPAYCLPSTAYPSLNFARQTSVLLYVTMQQ